MSSTENGRRVREIEVRRLKVLDDIILDDTVMDESVKVSDFIYSQ